MKVINILFSYQVYAFSFKSGSLMGVAFVDSQIYTVSLIAIRNLIVAADISRSVSLIRFQVRDSLPAGFFTYSNV